MKLKTKAIASAALFFIFFSCQIQEPEIPNGYINPELVNIHQISDTNLFPFDGKTGDQFGYSLDISGDGSIVVCGVPGDDDMGTDVGAVFIYEIINGYLQATKIFPSTINNNDNFGTSVAISKDGSTIVCGSPGDDEKGLNAGKIYLYEKVNGNWEGIAYTGNNISAGDHFGYAVDITDDGKTIVAGMREEGPQPSCGDIIIINRSTEEWKDQKIVYHSIANLDEWSCYDLSISGDGKVIVCSLFYRWFTSTVGGKVFFIEWTGDTWNPWDISKIHDAPELVSVDVNHDGKVIAMGICYMDGNFSDMGMLRMSMELESGDRHEMDIFAFDGKGGDEFGRSVAVSSDGYKVAVGAIGVDDQANAGGGVYFYEWTGDLWNPWSCTKVAPTSLNDVDNLGWNIAIDNHGDNVISYARYADGNEADTGTVYVFNWE